jgi:hypothetical protein
MRIRRGAVPVILALAAASSSSACSSEEQLSPQPLPPQEENGSRTPTAPGTGDSSNLGTCSGTCCNKPAEGTACSTVDDSSCSWAVVCPGGLVLAYQIECRSGVWTLTNGCPAEGQTDPRGCPASQPENGSSCTPQQAQSGGSNQCGYVLECDGYRKSAQAFCGTSANGVGTSWTTTPLGTCD